MYFDFLYFLDMETAIVTLNIFGKLGTAAAYCVIFIYTAEIFPTSMRSLGIGACSTAARIGGILAPFVAQLV